MTEIDPSPQHLGTCNRCNRTYLLGTLCGTPDHLATTAPRGRVLSTTNPGVPTVFWATILSTYENSARMVDGTAFWSVPKPSEDDRITAILDSALQTMTRKAMQHGEEQAKARFQRTLKTPAPLCEPFARAGDPNIKPGQIAVWTWEPTMDPASFNARLYPDVARVAGKEHAPATPPAAKAPKGWEVYRPPAPGPPLVDFQGLLMTQRQKAVLEEAQASYQPAPWAVQYHHGVPPGTAWLMPEPVPFAEPYPEEPAPMPNITEFLLARIAEDEREANVCLASPEHTTRRWHRMLAECKAKREIIILSLGAPNPPVRTDAELHAAHAHPAWEYATTEGPRKSWYDQDTPPDGEGWERNMDAGRDGWERFDYTEESYWRRPRPGGPRKPYTNPTLRALASVYADHPDYNQDWAA